MGRTVYALLVGINEYKSTGVTRLRGAVRDAETFAEYLKDRVAAQGDAKLELVGPLINDQATRQAILDGFESHLSNARAGDVAIFVFAGHGSRAKAPRELWPIEPDKKNETLVCYDSRTDGVSDLADKELAVLLEGVAKPGVHVVVILDCCHSGSATRAVSRQETLVRRIPDDEAERPIESFVGFETSAEREARLKALSARGPGAGKRSLGDESGWPRGAHVLMAACNEYQLASEYPAPMGDRGAFSYFLIEALQAASGSFTYRDVFARAGSLLRGAVVDQSPQLETADSRLLDQPFLGGAVRPSDAWYPVSHRKGEAAWRIEAGRLHGLPSPSDRDPLEFALFEFDASPEVLGDPSKALGRARAVEVGALWSRLTLLDAVSLDPTVTYKAVVVRTPLPRLPVRIEGDAEGVRLAAVAVESAGPGGLPSNFVRACGDGESPGLRLICRRDEFEIARPADDLPLGDAVRDVTPEGASRVVRRLEHVARWTQTLRLRNAPRAFDSGAVEMTLIQDGQVLTGPEYRFEYRRGPDGEPTPAQFKIRIRNKGVRDFYVGLLALTEDFGISDALQRPAPCTRLLPDAEFWAFQNKPIKAYIPESLRAAGVVRRSDILLMVVCTGEFDARLLTQPGLDQDREAKSGKRGLRSSLDRLMDRVQTREAAVEAEDLGMLDDWTTSLATLTIVIPEDMAPVPGASPTKH